MTTVELVVTDTRIWARGSVAHWDITPSIVLGSNDFDLVVGESLTPPTQVASAVQFIHGARIALLPRLPSPVDAMAAVVGAIMANLRVAMPCDRVTVACPTEWGPRARGVLAAAIGQFATQVDFVAMALRTVEVDEGTARSRRTVVLEFGTLATTATAVTRNHHGVQIEACECEPTLSLAEIGNRPDAAFALEALIGRVLADCTADVAQVVGVTDSAKLELIAAAVERVCGANTELRTMSAGDLVRSPSPQLAAPPIPRIPPAEQWMQPLRQQAAALHPVNRRRQFYFGAAALVAVIAVVAAVVLVVSGQSDEGSAVASEIPPATTSSSVAPASRAPTSNSGVPAATYGRVKLVVPQGWRVVSPDPEKRIDLAPGDGSRLRISVIQQPVAAGTDYEQIAAELEAQIKQRPAGVMGDLRRDVVMGGRSGVSYTENPSDGSTVRWHVVLEHNLQVSIGCQYIGNTWEALAGACMDVATSIQVLP